MNESTLEDDAKEVFCLVFEGMSDEQLQLQIFPIDVLFVFSKNFIDLLRVGSMILKMTFTNIYLFIIVCFDLKNMEETLGQI